MGAVNTAVSEKLYGFQEFTFLSRETGHQGRNIKGQVLTSALRGNTASEGVGACSMECLLHRRSGQGWPLIR